MVGIIWIGVLLPIFLMAEYYYSSGKAQHLELLSAKRSASGMLYYKDSHERILGVARGVIAKFTSSIDPSADLSFPFSNLQEIRPGVYRLEVNDPLEVSSQLVESGLAQYAHPDFWMERAPRYRHESFLSEMWHLEDSTFHVGADVNVLDAWRYQKGQGVKVAIIDDAFDTTHEDLQNAFALTYDVNTGQSNVLPGSSYQIHGTMIAGMIAARENDQGVVGVAPMAELIGIKESNGFTSSLLKAFAYAKEVGADVINCSWGTYNVQDSIRDAIDDLAKYGRDGKGVVIVFAAGNDDVPVAGDESALESVIGVGASDVFNRRAWYSNYGPELDLLAPGGSGYVGITTTDVSGSWGRAGFRSMTADYNLASEAGVYGTSLSAPIVSGAAAILLSIDPDMTRDEVVKVLQESADKIGSESYINGRNDYHGYGKLNIGKAAKMVTESQQKSFVELRKGWNLVALPVEEKVRLDSLSGWQIVYGYEDGRWIRNGEMQEMRPGQGYWVESAQNSYLEFDGTKYESEWTPTSSWQLLGAGQESAASILQTVSWVYREDWVRNPETIYRGEGFWIKLQE